MRPLYYQSGSNQDSTVTWKMADTAMSGRVSDTAIRVDSSIQSNNAGVFNRYNFSGFYRLFDSCTSFGYINCDHLATDVWGTDAQYTVVHVVVTDRSFDKSNTQVFFVFPTINSSGSLDFYNESTNAFGGFEPKPSFPVGELYKVVVISFKDDGYYYVEKSGTITADMDLTLAPTPETLGDIRARLSGL